MNKSKHPHNIALFLLLLSLLFLPVGSFGLVKILPNASSSNVLSITSVKTIQLDEPLESTPSFIEEVEEEKENLPSVPETITPFNSN